MWLSLSTATMYDIVKTLKKEFLKNLHLTTFYDQNRDFVIWWSHDLSDHAFSIFCYVGGSCCAARIRANEPIRALQKSLVV